MGIFDAFKKSRVKRKGKKDIIDEKDIGMHLRELEERRATIYNKSSYGSSIPLRVEKVEPKRVYLRSLGSFVPGSSGEKLTFEYEKGGWRYKFTAEVIGINEKTNLVAIKYPKAIRDNERRREGRAIIPPIKREYVKCLTGLGSGIGISGPIRDISTLGLGMIVEKMVDLAKQKEVKLSANLLKTGKEFQIIRFKLPGTRELEVSGKLIYVLREGMSIRVGIEFIKASDIVKKNIQAYKGR